MYVYIYVWSTRIHINYKECATYTESTSTQRGTRTRRSSAHTPSPHDTTTHTEHIAS